MPRRGGGAPGRALGAVQSLRGDGKELCSPRRSPKGACGYRNAVGHGGGGYLQVRADSPQDVVDAVAGDEGHKDVLQEKERSCRARFPPISNPVPHRQGTGRDVLPLNFPSFGSRIPPRRHLPAEFPCCYFCSLLKPGPDFFGAGFARLLSPCSLPRSAQRDAAANRAGSNQNHPHGLARGNAGQRSPRPMQSPRNVQSSLATRSL